MPDEPLPALDPDDARERLEHLDSHIDEVKGNVEDDLEEHEDRPLYSDSGATPEEDDQTITPG